MPATDAIIMDNVMSVGGYVQARGGANNWASVSPGTLGVGTLASWVGPSSSKLWAFSPDTGLTTMKAYDITAGGAGVSNAGFLALGRSQNSAYMTSVMFNNVAGHYLVMADESGSEPPALYDGTNWTEPSITGASNLVHVNLFKYRLYFVEKNTLSIWYLGVDAISGALTELPLRGYFNKGGSLLATGTWTVDGGDGMNDLFIAVTSKGQVAVFRGDNPDSASSWQLVGVFDIAEPIGSRRCIGRDGADLFILTVDGVFSLANVMAGRTKADDAFTEKIRTAYGTFARKYKDEKGWGAIAYPRGRYFQINVPGAPYFQDGTTETVYQFVWNTSTKTWSRFIGQNAVCWVLHDDRLYFGRLDSPYVFRADDGQYDEDGLGDPVAIEVDVQTAFTDLGVRGRKYFTLVRPHFMIGGNAATYVMEVLTDFEESLLVDAGSTEISGTGSSSLAPYEDRDNPPAVVAEWLGVGAIGQRVSGRFRANVRNAVVGWIENEYAFKPVRGFL